MSHDTLIHRAVRPAAGALARWHVSPNTVTVLRIATGAAAVAWFAAGSLPPGAAAFLVSGLLDRLDGEVARRTGRFSRLGHWLDLVADCSIEALSLLALGVGLRGGALGWWAPLLGVSAGVSVVALFFLLNRGGAATRRAAVRRAFDPDDATMAIPVLLLLFGAAPVVLLGGVLTPLAVLGVLVAGRRASI